MIWSWKKAQWRRFPLVLNRFTAPVSLTAVDNDRLVTVSEREHNVKLQRMFQELWLIMFRSFTDIYGFASHTNEISCFLVQSVWIWVTTAPHNVTTVQYCKILQKIAILQNIAICLNQFKHGHPNHKMKPSKWNKNKNEVL